MMYEDEENHEIEVDRREEVVTTQLPGYAATEHIVRDVAAERRIGLGLVYRFMWSVLGFLEILLAFRFVLRLIGANPNSGFAILMYGVTGLFAGPFYGLVSTPTFGGSALELTTLIAMVVYALFFLGLSYIIWMITTIPSARSFSSTVREESQRTDGSVRTIHTTISNKKL